jgi:hypothetical protein
MSPMFREIIMQRRPALGAVAGAAILLTPASFAWASAMSSPLPLLGSPAPEANVEQVSFRGGSFRNGGNHQPLRYCAYEGVTKGVCDRQK